MTVVSLLSYDRVESASPRFAEEFSSDPDIILDISRLLSRVMHPTPTGIDRVEMAYALGLLAMIPKRLTFAATHHTGMHGTLPTVPTVEFLHLTTKRWETEGRDEPVVQRWRRAFRHSLSLLPRPLRETSPMPRAYIHPSPTGLDRPPFVQALRRSREMRFIPFVHDLIPLQHPEFAAPKSAARFGRRLGTILALADGVLVNTADTAKALAEQFRINNRLVPIRALPLGVTLGAASEPQPQDGRPYFVIVSTIEPRKNHSQMLHIWRHFAERRETAIPNLFLVGRRGWDNGMIVSLLDRSEALKGNVFELNRISDGALRGLIRDACAVLVPSFAEGFGLPVAEALALGTPVLASDIPALREAGGNVAEYFNPLDGAAWMEAIREYSKRDSLRRRAQLCRLRHWQAPNWPDHLSSALDFVKEICQ